jgi:hypothetical protein
MPENLFAPKTRTIFYSLPTIIVFFVAVFIFFTPYSSLIWVQIPFHSAIEATGAIVALILSVLLLTSKNEHTQEFFKVIIASALIGMGVLDLFHSFMEPGQTFVWLHSTATFLGGVIFSFVWLPKRFFYNPLKIPITLLVFSCCVAFLSMYFPENIPVMLQGDRFTSTAEIINLVGGFGFFFASAWFFKNYFHSINQNYILFANLCLLFGVSAVLFDFSEIWGTEWWIWHATRLLAYSVALLFIFKMYKNTEDQKDTILIELQDALKNIKVLKGFLPICASCKKIRDDKGYWNQIESYIKEHSEAEFSHSICPECAEKLYPDINPYKK